MVTGTRDPATITVAIATFNRRDMLERAVQSVLAERRVPILLHVHDNASTDATEAFMGALVAQEPRVRYTRHATNRGSLANIAGSLGAIESAYFVPLADDDYLLPGFLHDAHAIMEGDAELGATAFYAESRDEAGGLVNTWPNHVAGLTEGKLDPAAHLREWMVGSHYSWQAVLWSSKVLAHLGAPYLHTGLPSDVDFQAQVFAKFPVFVVKRPGAVFFVHAGQESHRLSVADVPCWAKLFARLDKAIETTGVLPRDEYVQRRTLMWQRMRPSWLRPSRSPLSLSGLARHAVSAGFRLGDWELAFHLAAEVRAQQATTGDRIGSHLDLAIGTLESLHAGIGRERALAAQVDSLVASAKVLQDAALAVTADRNRLAAELAALRRERDTARRPSDHAPAKALPPSGPAEAFASPMTAAR